MSRYTERAENTARMLDVCYQTSLLPQPTEFLQESWRKLLTISKLEGLFLSQHKKVSPEHILDFMIFDENNASSIINCLKAARENARAIRGRITSEAWETQNTTWLEFQKFAAQRNVENPTELLYWIKNQCHLFRGVANGTMLKNEVMIFMSIGTMLERADNTARILETQYQDRSQFTKKTNRTNDIDSDFFDFYHWAALLRSVSAFEIYRQIYSDQITPQQAAELLIFNPQLPRSLIGCINELIADLDSIQNQEAKEVRRLIGKLKAELNYTDIDEVFNQGLEAFIKKFLEKINHIANEFSNAYLIPLTVA